MQALNDRKVDLVNDIATLFNLWRQDQPLVTGTKECPDQPAGTARMIGLTDTALDDVSNAIEIDCLAVEIIPGSAFKLALTPILNATTFETWDGHIEQRQDGSHFKRATITHDCWIGDSFQRMGGELTIILVEHQHRYYAVECTKRYLRIQIKAHREIWKLAKGGQTMRNPSWIYEPARFIDVGAVEFIPATDAEQVAYGWHREQLNQLEALGQRVGRTYMTEAKPELGPIRARGFRPAEARRFVEALSDASKAAISKVI